MVTKAGLGHPLRGSLDGFGNGARAVPQRVPVEFFGRIAIRHAAAHSNCLNDRCVWRLFCDRVVFGRCWRRAADFSAATFIDCDLGPGRASVAGNRLHRCLWNDPDNEDSAADAPNKSRAHPAKHSADLDVGPQRKRSAFP